MMIRLVKFLFDPDESPGLYCGALKDVIKITLDDEIGAIL